MPCVVAQDGDQWTIDVSHVAYPKSQGLGDRVAFALNAVGITKRRVAAALGVKDCGCQQRQQWLNEVGYRVGIGTPDHDHTGTTDLDAHG
jgi:hypothetical protein